MTPDTKYACCQHKDRHHDIWVMKVECQQLKRVTAAETKWKSQNARLQSVIKVPDLAAQLQPVIRALNHYQHYTCSIADACHVQLKVLSNTVIQPYVKLVEEHLRQGVLDEYTTAYMLHVSYKGGNNNNNNANFIERPN